MTPTVLIRTWRPWCEASVLSRTVQPTRQLLLEALVERPVLIWLGSGAHRLRLARARDERWRRHGDRLCRWTLFRRRRCVRLAQQCVQTMRQLREVLIGCDG